MDTLGVLPGHFAVYLTQCSSPPHRAPASSRRETPGAVRSKTRAFGLFPGSPTCASTACRYAISDPRGGSPRISARASIRRCSFGVTLVGCFSAATSASGRPAKASKASRGALGLIATPLPHSASEFTSAAYHAAPSVSAYSLARGRCPAAARRRCYRSSAWVSESRRGCAAAGWARDRVVIAMTSRIRNRPGWPVTPPRRVLEARFPPSFA